MDLAPFLGKCNGILAIGDVHADIVSLEAAYNYAINNNLFFVSLGDLVDSGSQPLEVVTTMLDIVNNHTGALVIGNHDSNYLKMISNTQYNYMSRPEMGETVRYLGPALPKFLDIYHQLLEHELTDHVHTIGNWIFTHGAFNSEFFKSGKTKQVIHDALYGQTSGERGQDGYPIRLYDWIDGIPAGYNVVVGHDRRPLGVGTVISRPLVVHNESKGTRAIFSDTSCSKGGRLSGIIIGGDMGYEGYIQF